LQGFSSYYCSNIKIYNNTFRGTNAISLRESQNNTIYNNSFIGLTRAILMTSAYDSILSDNNTFYYNNFSQTILYHFDYTAISTYNNQFNTTSGNLTQGNTYSDYCDKGTDINNDGYADASSGATVNWPYSENISTKISATGSSVVDYGPRIINCPPSEVYLSTVTSSTISTNAAVSGGSAPAAPAAAPPAFAATTASSGSSAPYSPADIKKYLKSESLQTKQTDGITTVTFTLENTGTQPMQLFPNILQEVDDPFFIVTRKTLGGENSKFTEIAHLSYSDTPVAGRLLKATIVNPADIVLQPGEKTEKTIEIKEGLAIPRQLKIQFTTLGESVLEKEVKVEKKVVSGTAVDVDTENHLLDIYAVLVPEKALMQKNGNGITGAAIGIPTKNSGAYYLEFSMDDNKTGTTAFTDLYGPYNLKQGQSFIFAQQLKYDPQYYAGNYVVKTKIIREDATLVKNELPIELGALLKQKDSFSEWFYLFFFLFLSGGLVIGLYLIYWQHRKSY
jgi:hypothetical protein